MAIHRRGRSATAQTLMLADRHERNVAVVRQDGAHDVEVEATMHGDQRRNRAGPGEWQCPDVGVGVDDVEFVGPVVDVGEHPEVDVRRDLFEFTRVMAKRKGMSLLSTSVAGVSDPPAANKVTSWPRRDSSPASAAMTRSVPP